MLKSFIIHLLGGYIEQPKDMRGGAIQTRGLLKDWSKEELIEHIAALKMNDNSSGFFNEYLEYQREYYRLKNILKSTYHTDKDLNRALHMADLENKVKELQNNIRTMQEKAEYFNKVLYATGLIVNCTGCFRGRPKGGEYLTEEKMRQLEHLVSRIRIWFNNHKWRMRPDNEWGKDYRVVVNNILYEDYVI